MVWAAGHKLQGDKYIIEQVLGQGGFGITCKARHTFLNNLVVIKTPNESLQNDPEYPKYVKRFIEEGRRLEKLSETQHPNIVRVRDLFHEGGIYCLVMDFVQGESLFNLVQRRGALPTDEAVKCIHQIGEALKVVHQAGLVHRDAHPGNIMVQQDGKAVLIDFGIAGEAVPATVSSKFFANVAFAPYEQMGGGREPRVDVYSLAASLYYAITGQRPVTSLDRKLYSTPLVPPQQYIPSISDDLNQAILKGMELEPQDRPQTMQEWLEMLAPKQVITVWSSGHLLRDGKYTIDRILAQGGFGITYLARHENGTLVVIKTLNEIVQSRPDFAKLQEDFVREALRLAKCSHPHIVRVDDVFQEGQLWCMAMEYIQGRHLADIVVNRGILPEAEALGYIRQIGEALTVVHKQGLLHRDVKPANIIVRADKPEAVLIDFGIAREFSPDLPQLHTANLSHCFAPIEQYLTVAQRGAYTDVYALAATLYFLLTKRLPPPAPLRANGTELLEPPQRINSSISNRVNRAISRGMKLEAKDRPQSMQEWLELLKEPQPKPTKTVPSSPPQQPVIVQPVNLSTPRPKTIPWGWLFYVVFIYLIVGFLSVNLGLVWAGAGILIWAGLLTWSEVMRRAKIESSESWSPQIGYGAIVFAIRGTGDLARAWVESLAWAGALAWPLAWVGTFVVIWALTLIAIGILFGLFVEVLSEPIDKLEESLSKWLIFLILAATSSLGLGLGRLVYQIFPIFN
ncbi:serine/threonine-protein kinase [Chlorogloeopsis sp. ULAP02]|uniref:serine/threonine protein kinase n=1 Tax=Chlorogloeopsis sp. ULAP02 TaxID=3107926 RepID=UPI00313541AF